MGTAARAFKQAGNKNIAGFKNTAADRAYPVAFTAEAVNAAFYMHTAVFAAVKGWEGRRVHQFSVLQFYRANRTNLGFSGQTNFRGFFLPAGEAVPAGYAYGEKKCVTKPEEEYAYYYKKVYLKKLPHNLLLAAYASPCIIYRQALFRKPGGSLIYYRYSNWKSRGFKLQSCGNFKNRGSCGLRRHASNLKAP